MQDITLRALEVLKQVHTVAAEDTRVVTKLLNHYGIAGKKLASVHEHNENRASTQIIAALEAGESVALVSDAGTPAFCDPGARLVAATREAGFRVVPIPGPNAAAAALSVSGFSAPQFLFYGFLPAKHGERREAIARIRDLPYLIVLYEAPHRIRETLDDLAELLGSTRRIVIARELTKIFESIHGCELGDAPRWISEDPNRSRGEFVLIVEGAQEDRDAVATAGKRALEVLLEELPVRQAAALAARLTGARKNDLYEFALSIKDAKGDA